MTTVQIFLAFVGLIAVSVVAIAWRYLPGRIATVITLGLPLWLLYVGGLSWLGVFEPVAGRPPGILLLFVPIILFVALGVVRSRVGLVAATAVPLALLHGLQIFRAGVELLLHQLHEIGLAPRMLTFEGANIDLYIALSAPLAALIARNGRLGLRLAFVWNIIGILALANVIVRSVLTAPGPLNVLITEVPNTFVSTFPYSLLPGLFPPLALTLHILSIRAIRSRLRSEALTSDRATTSLPGG
jgi:hypothetical protein